MNAVRLIGKFVGFGVLGAFKNVDTKQNGIRLLKMLHSAVSVFQFVATAPYHQGIVH